MLARFQSPNADRLASCRAPRTATRRRGMAVVESALVLSVFLMLLFGMFEYCRFLLVLHTTNNASRDGARYACVNLDKPSTFPTANYTDGSGQVYVNVQTYTQNRMGGVDKQIAGFQVAVYPVDQAGLDLVPPVVRPKSYSSTVFPDPFVSDPNTLPWNSAPFPDRIAVTIKGTYNPVVPSFLLMPSNIPIYITSIAGGEG